MRTALLASMVVFAGCSAMPAGRDGGTDGGDDGEPVPFKVTGTARVHPDALDSGSAASVAGLTLRVEEPLKVALNDPLGVFGTLTLDATGAYSVSGISSDLVNVGVAAGIRDDSVDGGTSGRIVRSATVVYDVAFAGKKPTADVLNTIAYAVPRDFHDKLTAALTTNRIRGLAQDAGSLVEAGCILGKIIDANGAPVAGVTIQPVEANKASRFFYPTADLSSTGASTSTNGLFIFLHNAGDVQPPFNFNVAGHSEYKLRSAGAAAGAVLVITVAPGS